MFAGSKPPMQIIRNACLTARIIAAIVLFMGAFGAIWALLQSPTTSKKWVVGIGSFMAASGAALWVLAGFDLLCKNGYEQLIAVSFALTFFSTLFAASGTA